ncbi:hypothetical protein A6F68_01663 [Tsuneonella dongtanensis]|uniref:DUF418 domain-containing protein n=1 Tax=Tsuneonella dongtanensis TaxID=692370 RepID=A0A1B2ADF3_9SPHN|nr:DUF418 domain-containing protein [Tsuneonella dongtanensis]ANY20176.1 hypothetical protein A6F68_01663 [Tsuneonella dongtanensis]
MTDAEIAATAAPVKKSDRIDSLDILRGIAVFGILLMNISAFGLIWQAYGNPYAAGGTDPLNLRLFEIMNVGFEGTMRGIFSLLFGAGIVLMTERMESSGAGLTTAEIHFRRMSWLMLFGFVHWALLLWTGEILFAYSLCGFLLFAFRKMAAKWQFAIGIAALAVAAVVLNSDYHDTVELSETAEQLEAVVASGGTLDPEQQMALDEWNEMVMHTTPTAESTAMFEAWHSGSYPEAVAGQWEFSRDFQWNDLPFWLFTDMMPFMLIGMALLKWRVLSAEREAKFYALMMGVGYAIGIPLGIYELGILQAGDYGAVASAEASRTYEFSRLAMVFGHLGLVLLVIRLGVLRWLQRGFAAAGQMALSNYIGQTLICTALFYGFGFGLYGQLDRSQLYLLVLTIAAVEMTISVIWLKNFRFGPLEWVWRSLTYWKPQPMRLSGGGSGPVPGQMLGAT